MKRNLRSLIKLATILILVAFCAGCTLSFYPLFSESELVFDSQLAGVWQDKEQGATFNFLVPPNTGTKNYLLQTTLKDQSKGNFLAQLGVLGKYRFLQIVPQKPASIGGEKSFYGGHFIQAYSFWKVTLETNRLQLTPLNYEWVESMKKQGKLDIKHEQRDQDFVVLTASTPELKAFVLKYADDTNAFGGGLDFTR